MRPRGPIPSKPSSGGRKRFLWGVEIIPRDEWEWNGNFRTIFDSHLHLLTLATLLQHFQHVFYVNSTYFFLQIS